MTTPPSTLPQRRQGSLLAYGMTGAMALALAACSRAPEEAMISPPANFTTNQVPAYMDTNQPPTSPYVHAGARYDSYLYGHGYYPIFGYPGYYYQPAPGSTVQLVTSGPHSYVAGSPDEANTAIARGGFGEHGGGGGGS